MVSRPLVEMLLVYILFDGPNLYSYNSSPCLWNVGCQ
jgi:hypothetical protein